MITSIPMAIGMAISVLVEALFPGGSGTESASDCAVGKPLPRDEKV